MIGGEAVDRYDHAERKTVLKPRVSSCFGRTLLYLAGERDRLSGFVFT